ncbi:hypothetical protein OCOL_000448 [Ordospora colligata]|uniref:Elongator complex protein 1 n=1 Tax=Ordospora colligata OC4 TaxID=1354746 RepID=A0A0B2UIW7_9MICR|nr:subunit IKAP of IkappaB kinase complex [Ordospora colligata OC4]KHN69002.1 subunit IKAP of IkappaB kinase complex [Ordospora colligata OC4]
MDNFFIRHIQRTCIDTEEWMYSKEYMIKNGVIYDCVFKKVLDVPFVVKYFHALTFEYLLVDELDTIYLANKNTLEIQEIGKVNDGIVLLSISRDEKWCVIVTHEEILLFDTYIEFKKSVKVDYDGLIAIEWTDRDDFALLTTKRVFFYDISLNIIGKSKEREYSGIAWRAKYNIFGCSCTEGIVFIEPNGLDHGDAIEEVCDEIAFLEDLDVLLTMKQVPEGLALKVLYTKNFCWYRKASIVVPGRFVCVEQNVVLFKDNECITRAYIFGEKTHFESEYYVIDGMNVLYTDFSKRIIPPPLFSRKIVCDNEVIDVFAYKNRGVILQKSKAIIFSVSEEEYKEDRVFLLNKRFDSVIVLDGFVVLKCGSEFVFKSTDEEYDITVDLVNNKTKVIECKRIQRIVEYLELVLNEYGNLNIVKMYNFNEKLCMVLDNGRIIYDGKAEKTIIDIRMRFEVGVDNNGTIIVHNGSTMSHNGVLEQGVDSFVLGEYGMAITMDRVCKITCGSNESTFEVDQGLKLLCMPKPKLIGETRHGTLETFMPLVYNLASVEKMIESGEYEEVIMKCRRRVFPFSMLPSHDIDVRKFVLCTTNSDLASFFNEVLGRMNGFELLLENEKIRRLRRVVSCDAVVEFWREIMHDGLGLGMGRGNLDRHLHLRAHFEEMICNDGAILMSSIGHLIGEPCDYPFNCRGSEIESKGDICGKNAGAFLNELLSALNLEYNFEFVIFLLVKMKRMDLAFRVAKHNIKKGVEYMLTITTVKSVVEYAMKTCDEDLVVDVMKICKKDASDVIDVIRGDSIEAQLFKVNEYFESRADAFYHFSRYGTEHLEKEYIKKHQLIDEASMYEACGISNKRSGFYYEICAEMCSAKNGFTLFLMANNLKMGLDTAVNNLFWREAILIYKHMVNVNESSSTSDLNEINVRYGLNEEAFYEMLVKRLIDSGMHFEAGQLIEEFIGDKPRAFEEYVRGKRMQDAYRVCTNTEDIKKEARKCLLERLLDLEDIKESFAKYSGRFRCIEERMDDELLSDTSFSYTEEGGGSRSRKLKSRPGGRYEKEFVMNKIREIALELMKWRDNTEDLIVIFKRFDMNDCIEAHDGLFIELRKTIASEIEVIFEDNKKQLYDKNRPIVEKPDMSKWT